MLPLLLVLEEKTRRDTGLGNNRTSLGILFVLVGWECYRTKDSRVIEGKNERVVTPHYLSQPHKPFRARKALEPLGPASAG